MHDSKCAESNSILILDFGSQYTHLIARRLHELDISCDLKPYNTKVTDLSYKPKGIILSGGPCSVYENGAPHADKEVLRQGIPVLGICYGLQEIAYSYGVEVYAGKNEYGGTAVTAVDGVNSRLFKGIPSEFNVWMSHGDYLGGMPEGFRKTAITELVPYCAIENEEMNIYGVQFHPEVSHTIHGTNIIKNFLEICEVEPTWSVERYRERQIELIREKVGDDHVICAVSGGVDSTVAAALVREAVGENLHAVLVDTGLLRLDEAQQAKNLLQDSLKIDVTVVDASKLFFERLHGVTDPEKKRKIIGGLFIEVFDSQAKLIKEKVRTLGGEVKFLLQGTLYTDVIESMPVRGGCSHKIKSHHNVGGLVEKMKLSLIEPLRELFKDEVRQMGQNMGINHDVLWRHPFPGPGLAIRITGEVTPGQAEILRSADNIFITEIKNAGLYHEISQAFCVLLNVKSVGVMGDQRTYEQTICLRAIKSVDFMTSECYYIPKQTLEKITCRIVNEVKGVNRVVFDLTTKPPSTIEWE